MRLTEKSVASLAVPPGQAQLKIQDEGQRGLYLVVGKATKTWQLKRKGRWTRVGGWPALSVATARQRALELLAADDLGRPMGLTVEGAYDLWVKSRPHAPPTLRSHSEFIRLHFGAWKDRDLAKITRPEIVHLHSTLARTRGPKAADNAIKAFRAWWSCAMKLDPALPVCPSIAVSFSPPTEKDESALLARLADWNTLLETAVTNPLRRTMLRFALLTGLRAGDVKTALWDHVQGDRLLVPCPKGGPRRAFSLPLLDAHTSLLRAAGVPRQGQRIFPLFTLRLSPAERKAFGDLDWSPHSLRRVFISVAVEAGLTPFEIALLVNHKIPGVTFRYIAKESDMRAAMSRVVDRLLLKLGSVPAS